jgi:hypothetical protein
MHHTGEDTMRSRYWYWGLYLYCYVGWFLKLLFHILEYIEIYVFKDHHYPIPSNCLSIPQKELRLINLKIREDEIRNELHNMSWFFGPHSRNFIRGYYAPTRWVNN